MRIKYLLPLIFLFFTIKSYSQIEVSAGMGLSYFFDSGLRDYVNEFTASNSLKTFNSEVEFFAEINLPPRNFFEWGVEYSYSIYSFQYDFGYSLYDLVLNSHRPSLIYYYVISGSGYKLKFGGGVGLRLLQFKEKLPYLSSYASHILIGWGFLFKASAFTTLGNNLFAVITANIRRDLPGTYTLANVKLFNNTDSSNGKINFNSLSVGFLVGISYQF